MYGEAIQIYITIAITGNEATLDLIVPESQESVIESVIQLVCHLVLQLIVSRTLSQTQLVGSFELGLFKNVSRSPND